MICVGFSWDHSDGRKLWDTYGIPRSEMFSNFIDVRSQAAIMGYHEFGLKKLSQLLLGYEPPGSGSVSSSPHPL